MMETRCVWLRLKAVDSPIGSDDIVMVDGRTDRSRLACVCVESSCDIHHFGLHFGLFFVS